MISVGEQTGGLDEMLSKIADFYDDEVDAAAGNLLSLLEPMMIVFLGAVNQGGGIYNFAVAQLFLSDAEVSGNSAGTGGGLYNYSNGIVTLAGGTSVCGNTAVSPPDNIANIGSLSGTNYAVLGGATQCTVP